MNREVLTDQVKSEYARLSSDENKEHISRIADGINPEAYYEKLLNMVLKGITEGTFDAFNSGKDIMEAVAKDKTQWLPEWNENDFTAG